MRGRIAICVALLAVLAGCGDEQSSQDAVPTPAERIAWRDEDGGLTVRYPETWRRSATPLTPHLGDPVEVLALGTYSLRPGGDRCAHQPVNAVDDLG
ncbi:MAG: hypothetical protein H0V45_11500, partial [Actinobacteria bacterium]|nr:hypothetical protein [Actinomycetota bacterium]